MRTTEAGVYVLDMVPPRAQFTCPYTDLAVTLPAEVIEPAPVTALPPPC